MDSTGVCRYIVGLLAGLILVTSCSTPSVVATQSIQKGDEMNNLNRYEQAIIHYEEYLRVSPQLGIYRNPSMEANVCRRLAYAYSTQGKYRRSLEYLNRALGIDSTVSTSQLEVVEDFRQIGMVHAYSGDFKEAMRNLEKSLVLNSGMERSAKSIKQSSIADTYLALAQLNLTLGNYNQTQEYAVLALKVYQKLPDGFMGRVESNLLIGIVKRDMGDLKSATELIESSRKLAEQNKLNTGRQLTALGEIHSLQGEIESAIRYKTDAVSQAENSNIKPQIIIAYMRLGDEYMKLGDRSAANNYYEKALQIQSEMAEGDTLGFLVPGNTEDIAKVYDYQMQSGSSVGAGLVSLRLGEMMLDVKDYDSAKMLLRQAQNFFIRAGNKEGVSRSNLTLGRVCIATKEHDEAHSLLLKALSETAQPYLKWQAYYEIGNLYFAKGDIGEARKGYENSLEVIESMRANLSIEEFKTAFANNKTDVYDKLIVLLIENRNKWSDLSPAKAVEKSFRLNELARSRAFLDLLGNKKVDAKRSADTVLLNREQLLRLKIVQLVQELNRAQGHTQSVQQLRDELDEAQSQHTELLQRIKLNNAAYATVVNVEPSTLSEVQSVLDNKTCLLQYWMSDRGLVIWLVTRSSLEAKFVSLDKESLKNNVVAARRAISLRLEDVSMDVMAKLYKTLISPVEAELSKFENAIIIPHQSLHFLPFQSLLAPSGRFMIQKHVLNYAPSASILYYCMKRKLEAGNKFLGVALGDVAIGNLPGLPGTELEVEQLAQLYSEFSKRSKAEVSETDFKKEVSDYNYVHVATHGILLRQQPLYSYLLMSDTKQDDGRLTVNEIFGLDIKSKIVTLSACETGLGDLSEGDEIVGLSRAFIYAGSPGVIVSLWKVDDATTAWLMTRFHQYLTGGSTPSQSLAFAQRDMITRNFTSAGSRGMKDAEFAPEIRKVMTSKTEAAARNPYFWAPFILIGNGFIN